MNLPANDNTPPFPAKQYEIIYADPPWRYRGDQKKQGATGNHYETMVLDDIKALDIQSITAKKAVCFMWATAKSMMDVPSVMDAWGFHHNPNHLIWRKTTKYDVPYGAAGGCPSYIKSQNIEYLFIGSTKKWGLAPWVGLSHRGAKYRQVIEETEMVDAQKGKHSHKPERFREIIVDLCGERSRIELFARRAANDDWDVWGNQANE